MSTAQVVEPRLVYLLEILARPDGDTAECDNFAALEVAIERALEGLRSLNVPIEVEVTLDEDQQLEGIAFFNEQGELLGLITAYHMERDTDLAHNTAIQAACRGPLPQLEAALNSLLRH
ncbi:hypothetical protein D3C71_22450 [compost metagenome]